MNTIERNIKVIVILGVFALLCFAMLYVRISVVGSFAYLFLLWNLFLAWIPVVPAIALNQLDTDKWQGKVTAFVMLGGWLMFFPNAPYILTDITHLRFYPDNFFWFDLVLILSFAMNGLLIGFISLLEVHRFFNKRMHRLLSWTGIFGILLGSAFGVYIGRFLRWNSWDVFLQPQSLLRDILAPFIDPTGHLTVFAFTLGFGLFLLASYGSIILCMNALAGRDMTRAEC